jgi:hypothetical protein
VWFGGLSGCLGGRFSDTLPLSPATVEEHKAGNDGDDNGSAHSAHRSTDGIDTQGRGPGRLGRLALLVVLRGWVAGVEYGFGHGGRCQAGFDGGEGEDLAAVDATVRNKISAAVSVGTAGVESSDFAGSYWKNELVTGPFSYHHLLLPRFLFFRFHFLVARSLYPLQETETRLIY